MTSKVRRVRTLLRTVRIRGGRVRDECRISIPSQMARMAWFFRKLRTTEDEFYDFRLYDNAQSLDDRLTYLSWKRWSIAQDLLNPVRDRVAVKNKSEFARILADARVATVATCGVIDLREGLDGVRRVLREAANIDAVIRDGMVIKPEARSHQGRGVLVFRRVDSAATAFETLSGQTYDVPALYDELRRGIIGWDRLPRFIERFILQPRLISHATLRDVNPATLCTVRIVTLLQGEGAAFSSSEGTALTPSQDAVQILGASFKIGIGTKGTDNYNDGGIAVAIDLASGRLGTGCRKHDDARYSIQPETGVRFDGLVLPFWPESVSLVKQAACALPRMRTLGWDVALTDSGPVIVEANADWSSDLVQRPQQRGLWRPPLKTAYEEECGDPASAPRRTVTAERERVSPPARTTT